MCKEEEALLEEELVKKAIKGDHASFSSLVTKYRNKLYRFLFFMVHHEEDALDLVQDTFLKAYESLPKLKNPQVFSSWISRIGMNLAVNHIKRKGLIRRYTKQLAENSSEKHEELPEKIIERQEVLKKIQETIEELPPKQKVVFVLCDIQGHSYQEIADIVECNIGTVMSRLFYARNFLKKHLKQWEDQESIFSTPITGLECLVPAKVRDK